MRTLALTSPLMHGDDVQDLQVELIKRGYLKDKADSQYGILTAQAVYRAKYWLGFVKPDKKAGPHFWNVLTGKTKPNIAMKALAAKRHRAKAKVPMRLIALANARKYLGDKENPPGSNRITWASSWYGLIGAWCNMAVSRWYVDAGSKGFKRGQFYAYVPYMVQDARRGVNGLAVTKNPQPGDVVAFDWNNDGTADHTGLFEKWILGTDGDFDSIEGNTAVGNDSNGGQCMRRRRNQSDVQVFIHVSK